MQFGELVRVLPLYLLLAMAIGMAVYGLVSYFLLIRKAKKAKEVYKHDPMLTLFLATGVGVIGVLLVMYWEKQNGQPYCALFRSHILNPIEALTLLIGWGVGAVFGETLAVRLDRRFQNKD